MEGELRVDRARELAVQRPPPTPICAARDPRRAQDTTVGDISQEPGLGVFASSLGATSHGSVYALTTPQSAQVAPIPSASWSSEPQEGVTRVPAEPLPGTNP